MNTVLALSGVVIKEMYRRKDFYVLFVLTAIITLGLGSLNFFNDDRIVRSVKDVCLLLIWISSLVIATTTAARQIPAERENRTIFPLLAKPVTRGHVVTGKFAGCWFASGITLLVFYLFFMVISGTREHAWPVLQYVQAFLFHWGVLGIVIALVLLGSVVFTAASSNVTISFILVLGIMFVGRHLNTVALQQPEPLRTIVYTVYFLIPHLEWFDLRDLVIYGHQLVGWLDIFLGLVYAAVYTALLLVATWVVFARKALNL